MSEYQQSAASSSQTNTYQMDAVLVDRAGERNVLHVVCSTEAIRRTVNVDISDRLLSSSHPTLSHSRLTLSTASSAVSLSSAVSHSATSQNTLPASIHVPSVVRTLPRGFAMPFTQSLAVSSLMTHETAAVTQQSLARDHPSYAINRLREKIGRGWLPPEPPYPPPPDDVPPTCRSSAAESTMSSTVSCVGAELVDCSAEVTTTTSTVDDDAHPLRTLVTKRQTEREDGEISDDEPDSIGADLPPDSSGIPSSNGHWDRYRPPSFRGFRVGRTVISYRPRLPYHGRFPRPRGFFRGRGFVPWRQWYDERPSRDWRAADDEPVVDSSGVLSPVHKHCVSSVHSPISSTDSESDQHSSKCDRRSRCESKSKHADHPVADSTRTSLITSPEFEASSDSDKEPLSHQSASKKKVSC